MSQYYPARHPDRLYKARLRQGRTLLAAGGLASALYHNAVADTAPGTPEDIFLAGRSGIGSHGSFTAVTWLRVCESRGGWPVPEDERR